ncbi:MAG: hypothetical protein ABIH52_03340 [Candidatus Aenigmatarchaeota archaeon]|nr:hypothetical protein [Nanoarchaeota archaeon]
MRGQSSFVMIFLLIMVVGFIILFLFSFVGTVKDTEYTQLYTTNLLLSMMRSDTGYTDPNCRLVSDALYCGFKSTYFKCGDSGKTCYEVAYETIESYLDNKTGIAKKSFRHYLFVEPQDWQPVYRPGEPITFEIGDEEIGARTFRGKRTSENELIGSGFEILNVRLFVTES